MADTGAARGVEAGGSGSAVTMPPPPPPPPPISYPLDALGKVRTRGDLAALINEGAENIVIKTEISGQGYEPMDDDVNEVVCMVSLDERNRIIALEDPFHQYETGGEEDYTGGSEGEEILEESEDGEEETVAGEEGEDEVGAGEDCLQRLWAPTRFLRMRPTRTWRRRSNKSMRRM
jgi:hypothetical protein